MRQLYDTICLFVFLFSLMPLSVRVEKEEGDVEGLRTPSPN
jgi:predicted secreted protein